MEAASSILLADLSFFLHLPGGIFSAYLVVCRVGGSRKDLAVFQKQTLSKQTFQKQAASLHVCEGQRISLESPRMGKTHKYLKNGTVVNIPSCSIQALIM